MGGRREGRGAEEAGEVGLVPRIIPPGVIRIGLSIAAHEGSSSLVEWCWGNVGDRMGTKAWQNNS